LLAIIEQLEGFEAPAGHWERHILPARLESYDPSWLDTLTFMGQAGWARVRLAGWVQQAGETNGRPLRALTRSTPIALVMREHFSWLLESLEQSQENSIHERLSSNAWAALEAFTRHGALFPAQIGGLLDLVPSQVENVLGELAAAGLVTSDGYPALRALLGLGARPSRHRMSRSDLPAPPPAGRWTLLRSPLMPLVEDEQRIENWCRLLLRRYGVMFRELIGNESVAPRWGELVRVYRRMEARGEIRYGHFVESVAGEQFALPEVIPLLRAGGEARSDPVRLPATDPINLTGRIVAGPRVPALPGQSIAIVNGALTTHSLDPA
jgi:ATP-dependent Lhr-like helicase